MTGMEWGRLAWTRNPEIFSFKQARVYSSVIHLTAHFYWERSLMEEFARLAFPNGRTGGPCVDEGLVILHAITANWGTNGPARDRFFTHSIKLLGELVWTSTPGTTPQDSSFAPLVFEDLKDGRRVFYSGTGCGHVVCVDARTGQPLWRFKMSHGGVNAGVVLYDELVIAVHGKEMSIVPRLVEWLRYESHPVCLIWVNLFCN